MKKINLLIAGAALLMGTAACSDEFAVPTEGEVTFNTSFNSDLRVISRAEAENTAELSESAIVWIYKGSDVVRKYQGLDAIAEPVKLAGGSYTVKVWAGVSHYASFDHRYYKGQADFTVAAGATSVPVVCRIANTAAAVNYSEAVDKVLTDYTMTIGHSKASLVYEGREERTGYFMMPTDETTLTYTIRGTKVEGGGEFEQTGTLTDVKPTTKYILNVSYKAEETEGIGGAMFTIEVGEEPVGENYDANVIAAPAFSGYGFDLRSTVIGPKGSLGSRKVYVQSGREITGLTMEGSLIQAAVGYDFVDINRMQESVRQALVTKGIIVEGGATTGELDNGTTVSFWRHSFDFGEDFLNGLEDGEYAVKFTATDAMGLTATATLAINVTDALVITEPIPDENIGVKEATLVGSVSKDGVETVGFNYRQAGTATWTYVEGVASRAAWAKGDKYYATITGLTPGTTYEYAAVSGDFVSTTVETFTTGTYPQLPNASFEVWGLGGDKGNVVIPASSDAEAFWDSGNHGSSMMKKTLTDKSTDFVADGQYSAKLRSQYVGFFGVGAFAAGNLFIGEFLGTEDTTKGILGWGREFNGRPTAMKVHVKYTPEAVNADGAKDGYLKVGDMDKGIAYIALTDGTKKSYKNWSWPCLVRTADLTNYGFKKDADNVIGYGEHIFETATPEEGLMEITIPIDYRSDEAVKNVIVVFSASLYGDYYCGGEGSTMYVDNVELVYE